MYNSKSFVRVFKNIYTGSIITAGTLGSMYGLKEGYKSASIICFEKKNLSYTEYACELFCFSGITVSSIMLYGIVSSLLVSTIPITLPGAIGCKLYNIKNTES